MKEIISTPQAPPSYSQGVRGGHHHHVRPAPHRPGHRRVRRDGIMEQTRQSLKNVQAVLEAGGSSLGNVLKTTVF